MSNTMIMEEVYEGGFLVFSEVCVSEEYVKYEYFTKYIIPYVKSRGINMFHDDDKFFKLFSKALSKFLSCERDEFTELFLMNLEQLLDY